MDDYAVTDASPNDSSVYIVGATDKVIREVKVANEPEAGGMLAERLIVNLMAAIALTRRLVRRVNTQSRRPAV